MIYPVRYSTVSEFFEEVSANCRLDWDVFTEDFFPYNTNLTFWESINVQNAEQGNGYWTGNLFSEEFRYLIVYSEIEITHLQDSILPGLF